MSIMQQDVVDAPTTAPGADPTPRRSVWPRWALAAALAAGVASFYALGLQRYVSWDYLRTHLDLLRAQVQQNLLPALLIFFLLYAATTALSLPAAAVLTLAAGALFGRWLGTGVVSLASTSGATLAFLSSRYLFRDFAQRRWGGRLAALSRGVERDGAYYLFTLRLIPAFPFFLVNLGMGLTRIPVRTFVWVSLLGMLPATFLYVNAGTVLAGIDSPGEVLSPTVLVSLALLGAGPLALRWLILSKIGLRTIAFAVAALLVLAVAVAGAYVTQRYATEAVMVVPLTEYGNADYPEDPANRSVHHGQYDGRQLTLVQKDETHFDFILEPTDLRTARVVVRDVDVGLMTPSLPAWTKADDGLRRIALTDRQWNRQQVSFGRDPAHVEVSGGDGFEDKNLVSAELAKNCLNAGLWEVLLFTKEDGQKALYYQGWFTFPMGHYKTLFERNTGLPYWRHAYYLEHWVDPAGTAVPLDGLRRVTGEREVPAAFDRGEAVLAAGEQLRKRRTVLAENVLDWGDFYDGRKVRFAQFVPPGRYSVTQPWKNEYWRMDQFEKAVLRDVVSPATERPLQELELVFGSDKARGKMRFLVSGFEVEKLPQLAAKDYPKGLYMPMGIGTPPFFQGYADLEKNPPEKSSYFSVTLDEDGCWINHHDLAIDGPVLHRDADDPTVLHVYLLSYERHTLIGHWRVETRK